MLGGNYMKNEKSVTDIRKSSFFHKRDLFIYLIISAFIALLFLAFFVFKPTNINDGFKLSINNKVVMTHIYGQDFEIDSEYSSLITITPTSDGYEITIKLSQEKQNVLTTNETKKTVLITDSTCHNKTCVHMQGMIYCAPHSILVTSLAQNEFIPPVSG